MPIMTNNLTLSSIRLWQGFNLVLHFLLSVLVMMAFLMSDGYSSGTGFFIKLGSLFEKTTKRDANCRLRTRIYLINVLKDIPWKNKI